MDKYIDKLIEVTIYHILNKKKTIWSDKDDYEKGYNDGLRDAVNEIKYWFDFNE